MTLPKEMVSAEAAGLPAGPLAVAEAEAEAAETVTPGGRHHGVSLMTKEQRRGGEDLPVAILLLPMIRAEDPRQTRDTFESSTARTPTRLSHGRRRPTRSPSAHGLPQLQLSDIGDSLLWTRSSQRLRVPMRLSHG